MKLLVVSQHFWPEKFRINDICKGLSKENHEIYVLTGGGPGTSTSLIVQYIFTTGFASSGSVQNFGLAAAASMVLGVVLLFLTLMQLYFSRNKESKHQEI